MAVAGMGIKFFEVRASPAIFDLVFFGGPAYALMIMGWVLVVLALGHELLFREG